MDRIDQNVFQPDPLPPKEPDESVVFKRPVTHQRKSSQEMVISNAAQSLLLVVNGALPNHLSRLSDPQRALLMQHFASKNPDPVRLGLIYTKLFEDPRRISF